MPVNFREKCPRCGGNRWRAFADKTEDVLCTRCYFIWEEVNGNEEI